MRGAEIGGVAAQARCRPAGTHRPWQPIRPGYQGVAKREETQDVEANWHVAMRPGKRRALDKNSPMGAVLEKLEQRKASIRAKVEHPFRVIKRQFGHVKVRYRGLAKNTAQLHTLFALSNLWMVRRTLLKEARG